MRLNNSKTDPKRKKEIWRSNLPVKFALKSKQTFYKFCVLSLWSTWNCQKTITKANVTIKIRSITRRETVNVVFVSVCSLDLNIKLSFTHWHTHRFCDVILTFSFTTNKKQLLFFSIAPTGFCTLFIYQIIYWLSFRANTSTLDRISTSFDFNVQCCLLYHHSWRERYLFINNVALMIDDVDKRWFYSKLEWSFLNGKKISVGNSCQTVCQLFNFSTRSR